MHFWQQICIKTHCASRHLNGKVQQSAQEFEKLATKTVSRPEANVSRPKEDGSGLGPSQSQLQQPKIDVSLNKQVSYTYRPGYL